MQEFLLDMRVPVWRDLQKPPGSASPADTGALGRSRANGFTLVELIAVIGLIVVLMVLLIPALNPLKSAGDITKAAYDIAGMLEQARAYAMGNSTYVWVGFFEEDAGTSTTPATAGTGRVVMMAVASKDGTRYRDSTSNLDTKPAKFGGGDATNQVTLVPLSKLIKLENVHLGALNSESNAGNVPERPGVRKAYQVGDASFAERATNTIGGTGPNVTTFDYPLTGTVRYTFVKIIEFNRFGEVAKIVDGMVNGPQPWMEVAIQPTKGSVVDPGYAGTNRAAAAVQIEGITGRVQMLRQ